MWVMLAIDVICEIVMDSINILKLTLAKSFRAIIVIVLFIIQDFWENMISIEYAFLIRLISNLSGF